MLRNLLLLLMLATAPALGCQTIPGLLTVSPQQCVWHPGNNPAWAAQDLNETGWLPYSTWTPGPAALRLWIRCHPDLEPLLRSDDHPAVQVSLPAAWRLYLAGKLLGGNGDMATGRFRLDTIRTLPIPANLSASRGETLALSVTGHPPFPVGGPVPVLLDQPLAIRAGDASVLRAVRSSLIFDQLSARAGTAIGYEAIGLICLMALALYFYDRTHTELLLLSLTGLALALLRLNEICTVAQLGYSVVVCLLLVTAGNVVISITEYFFFFALAGRRMPLALRILVAVAVLSHLTAGFSAVLAVTVPEWVGPFGQSLHAALALPSHLVLSASPFFAFWPFSAVGRRLRPLAAFCFLWGAADIVWFTVEITLFIHPAGVPSLFARWFGVLLETRGFTTAAVLAALLALLFHEQRKVAEERAIMAGEMQAAREVQRLLVPLSLPSITGFQCAAAYVPAAEVGGDFYQVLPRNDGAALIVVGDVSGKGLKAAMTGSVVLGALRSLAPENLSPSQILFRLDGQLAASSDGGFVTCLIACIASDGTLALANAGHLAPYRNGEEVVLDSGLPLGTNPDAAYIETHLQLLPGDRLTLLSDGVVEAQNAAGELFGFDRTAAISTHAADEIARAAQHFGQQDDITVLTLTFAPAAVVIA